MSTGYKIFVVPHTHWDRAWYVSFEEFRLRLVRLIDRLCATLDEDPAFKTFALDGQTVVLEDYLAVRPQMEQRLKKFVKEGRLTVGPWYILPDLFLVSGESIIRNLILGHRISCDFGHTCAVGYVPDPFGHIAQLPQILNGFGHDNFVFGRGIDVQQQPLKIEFLWEGLDGSTVLAMHQRFWYNNAAFLGYRIGWGDTEHLAYDEQLAQDQVDKAIEQLAPLVSTRSLLLNNGVDHSEHQPELPGIIARAAARHPEHTFKIASFEEYVRSVKADLNGAPLERVRGELSYRYGDMLQGVYSTRMYLKTANRHCEDLLEKYAEPVSALAWLTGGAEYPTDFLWYAWRELLKNHPHDDICGCSVDQVHADMEHRFGVVEQIGDSIVRDSFRALTHAIDTTGQAGIPVCVFNPLGHARDEVIDLDIDLREDERWRNFALYDEDGQAVSHHPVKREDIFWMEPLKGFEVRRHRVQVRLSVPAFGYRTLYVRKGKAAAPPAVLRSGDRDFENEFYSLAIGDDGAVSYQDKNSGETFDNLLTFEDGEDTGDVYNYAYFPHGKQIITTAGAKAAIRKIGNGPLGATWRITHKLRAPASLTADRQARTRKTVALTLETELTCRAGSPRVDVVTRVTNTARDHRLRVLFPTPIAADTVMVDGHFGFIERPCDPPPPKGEMPPYPTQHQKRFASIHEGGTGFAVINAGLPEVEVFQGGQGRTIALTLFRAVDWLSRDDLNTRPGHTGPTVMTPSAQCLRSMEFSYAFMAHAGEISAVMSEALQHNVPCLTGRCDVHGGTEPKMIGTFKKDTFLCGQPFNPVPREGVLPGRGSLIDLGGGLILSAVKKCESRDTLIVRVYNPYPDSVRGTLTAFRPLRGACITNLNEERQETLLVSGNSLSIACDAYKILTLELEL